MIVNIMNILITTASEISSEKLILFLRKDKKYNIKCTELPKFKESCNKDLDIDFNNLEDSKNINFLIDKSDTLIHFTRNEFLTDNDSLNMYLRNTYNLLFSAIQKGIKKIIFISDLNIFNYYPGNYIINENWHPKPSTKILDLYSHLSEFIVKEYARSFPVKVMNLRIPEFFEPGKQYKKEDIYISFEDYYKIINHTIEYNTYRNYEIIHAHSNVNNLKFSLNKMNKFLSFNSNNIKLHEVFEEPIYGEEK